MSLVSPRLLYCLAVCLAFALFTGCESSEHRHARKMMWYRPPESKPPLPGSSFTVGRYGSSASYDVGRTKGATGGAGLEGSTSTGRGGSTATYDSWAARDVGGEPVENRPLSGRGGGSGVTLGTAGTTEGGSALGNEGSAEYGSTP